VAIPARRAENCSTRQMRSPGRVDSASSVRVTPTLNAGYG
jgi:hypothetical protein